MPTHKLTNTGPSERVVHDKSGQPKVVPPGGSVHVDLDEQTHKLLSGNAKRGDMLTSEEVDTLAEPEGEDGGEFGQQMPDTGAERESEMDRAAREAAEGAADPESPEEDQQPAEPAPRARTTPQRPRVNRAAPPEPPAAPPPRSRARPR